MSKIYTTTKIEIEPPPSGLASCSYIAGELVRLESSKENEEPILFIEHKPDQTALYRVISKLKTVPNGTVVFLLEEYNPSSKKGIVDILLDETRFLCMSSQIRKI